MRARKEFGLRRPSMSSFLACIFGGAGKWGNRAPKIPDEYTRPSGLYGGTDKLDLKRLKRFIQEGRLAPCFPGSDEAVISD